MSAYAQNVVEMLEDFSFLDDWEDRYTHVIEMGKALASILPEEKNEFTKVKGCVSQVWLVVQKSNGTPSTLNFRGDSDAHIVKGLVAIVLEIFSGRTAKEILEINAGEILSKLGLAEHLSPQRSNGLNAMIARIQTLAKSEI